MNSASRLVHSSLAVLLGVLAAADLPAQTRASLVPVRSPGFGGGAFFVSPWAATRLGSFDLQGEVDVGWGQSSAHEANGMISVDLPGAFRLRTALTSGSARGEDEHRSDHSLSLSLVRGPAALSVGGRRSHAAFEDYSSEINGFDVRLAVALGTPFDLGLGVTRRSSAVVQKGDVRLKRTVVVAGYEFVSVRRLEFIDASRHQDVEFELSAGLAGFRLSGFVGRGFSDGLAPDRKWAYARLAKPVARRFEILAEAGRNGGVPAIGRVPQNFARLGMRLNLSATLPPPATPAPDASPCAAAGIEQVRDELRLIVTAAAANVEIRGNFTAWQAVPMNQIADARWAVPVSAGVLHFNIRVNGRNWTVPAGVPVVRDEFSGAPVAVLVVTKGMQ